MKPGKLILILALILPLVACNDSGNNSSPQNGTVDVTYMHSSSKEMMGLRVGADPEQENLSQLSTEPVEYEKYINLDEKYQRLQPDEFMPIFREKIQKWVNSGVNDFGSRYLTRTLHFQHVSEADDTTACVYVTDEDHVVISDDGEKNISVIDSKATMLEMRNEQACYPVQDEIYLQKDFTRRESAEDIEAYFNEDRGQYQIYRVSENSFVEKNKWGVFFYHFRDDGLVHMDGILEYDGVKSLMSYIPQPTVDEAYVRNNFDGMNMSVSKEIPCEGSSFNGEEADYCSTKGGDNEVFQLDNYL